MSDSRCRILLTGFEPFGELLRNPSGDVARALARDARLRSLGLRCAVLPVHRHAAPRRLKELIARWRPATLLMTGVAAGRAAMSVERLAVNCYRRAGDTGPGLAIRKGGPDGLFASLPLEASVRHLSDRGAHAVISESAGTFTCNLVLYTALDLALREPGLWPSRIAFMHLPATPEALPEGDRTPSLPLERLLAATTRLIQAEARVLSR